MWIAPERAEEALHILTLHHRDFVDHFALLVQQATLTGVSKLLATCPAHSKAKLEPGLPYIRRSASSIELSCKSMEAYTRRQLGMRRMPYELEDLG